MRLKTSVIFLILIIFAVSSYAKEKVATYNESINTRLAFSGDIKGTFDLSGPLGTELKGSPYEADYPCEVSSLFRKVTYRKKSSVEAWLTLICVIEGQKKIYKPHRIYIDLASPEKAQKLPMLDKKLKNIVIHFSLFSLKIGN